MVLSTATKQKKVCLKLHALVAATAVGASVGIAVGIVGEPVGEPLGAVVTPVGAAVVGCAVGSVGAAVGVSVTVVGVVVGTAVVGCVGMGVAAPLQIYSSYPVSSHSEVPLVASTYTFAHQASEYMVPVICWPEAEQLKAMLVSPFDAQSSSAHAYDDVNTLFEMSASLQLETAYTLVDIVSQSV